MTDATSPELLSVFTALEANGASTLLERELDRATARGLLDQREGDVLRRIESSLVRGRRRESLLRVLLETTTDLVAITDFDAMLQAIVRRTRMLLGSDMAYISLNDYERRETFIHTTDGVATSAYRSIRMELGTGVLGKIASGTGSAQAIDYISDPDIIHVPAIDETVQQEGVRSIMGAPLLRDGVLLGALLVAERYQRRYTDEEVWLVESMSALACVALSNARLIGDMKAALGERDRLQDSLELERSRLASEQEFERALVDCAVSSDPYGQFLDTLVEHRGGQIWLLDDIGKPLRGTGELPLPEPRLEKALVRSHRSGEVETLAGGVTGAGDATDAGGAARAADAGEQGAQTHTVLAVGAATRILGGILVAGDPAPELERLLRRAAVMLSVLRLMDENTREEAVKAQTELVHELLGPTRALEPAVIRRAARFGLTRGEAVFVHVIESESRAALVLDALRAHRTLAGGVAAEYNGRAVFIFPENVGETIVNHLARRQVAATVGLERDEHFLGSLAVAYEGAAQTLGAMLALGLREQASSSVELGAVGMLMTSATPAQVNTIIDLELAPLLDYDAQRGAQLVHTLWAFFSCDRHQVRAAEQLHVHPNTLRQRLDRIAVLLGEDWVSARRSSMIFLALQLHRLRPAGA